MKLSVEPNPPARQNPAAFGSGNTEATGGTAALGTCMADTIQIKALLKKECYQAAVRMVDMTSNETNFVKLHNLSTDLADALFDAAVRHLNLDDQGPAGEG